MEKLLVYTGKLECFPLPKVNTSTCNAVAHLVEHLTGDRRVAGFEPHCG